MSSRERWPSCAAPGLEEATVVLRKGDIQDPVAEGGIQEPISIAGKDGTHIGCRCLGG